MLGDTLLDAPILINFHSFRDKIRQLFWIEPV